LSNYGRLKLLFLVTGIVCSNLARVNVTLEMPWLEDVGLVLHRFQDG
jgi:hypothetical protein